MVKNREKGKVARSQVTSKTGKNGTPLLKKSEEGGKRPSKDNEQSSTLKPVGHKRGFREGNVGKKVGLFHWIRKTKLLLQGKEDRSQKKCWRKGGDKRPPKETQSKFATQKEGDPLRGGRPDGGKKLVYRPPKAKGDQVNPDIQVLERFGGEYILHRRACQRFLKKKTWGSKEARRTPPAVAVRIKQRADKTSVRKMWVRNRSHGIGEGGGGGDVERGRVLPSGGGKKE